MTTTVTTSTTPVKLAIIGVSGRTHSDKKKLEAKHMTWATSRVREYIDNILGIPDSDIILVSGGSAWMDHVAVQLYLTGKFRGLELYLPSKFDHKQKQFVNTHEGRTLNTLHGECAEKTNTDVLLELTRVVESAVSVGKKSPIKLIIKRGFKPRNTLIAKNCDHLIGFTFESDEPTIGGTAHTWSKVPHDNKVHFDLSDA